MGPEYDAGVADGKAGLDPRPQAEWDDDQTLLYLDGHGWGEMIAQITDPDGPWAAARLAHVFDVSQTDALASPAEVTS